MSEAKRNYWLCYREGSGQATQELRDKKIQENWSGQEWDTALTPAQNLRHEREETDKTKTIGTD